MVTFGRYESGPGPLREQWLCFVLRGREAERLDWPRSDIEEVSEGLGIREGMPTFSSVVLDMIEQIKP